MRRQVKPRPAQERRHLHRVTPKSDSAGWRTAKNRVRKTQYSYYDAISTPGSRWREEAHLGNAADDIARDAAAGLRPGKDYCRRCLEGDLNLNLNPCLCLDLCLSSWGNRQRNFPVTRSQPWRVGRTLERGWLPRPGRECDRHRGLRAPINAGGRSFSDRGNRGGFFFLPRARGQGMLETVGSGWQKENFVRSPDVVGARRLLRILGWLRMALWLLTGLRYGMEMTKLGRYISVPCK